MASHVALSTLLALFPFLIFGTTLAGFLGADQFADIAINTIVGHLSGSDAVTSFRPGHCSVTKLQRENDVLRIVERGSEAATRVL